MAIKRDLKLDDEETPLAPQASTWSGAELTDEMMLEMFVAVGIKVISLEQGSSINEVVNELKMYYRYSAKAKGDKSYMLPSNIYWESHRELLQELLMNYSVSEYSTSQTENFNFILELDEDLQKTLLEVREVYIHEHR